MNDSEYKTYKARLQKRPLVIKWLEFLNKARSMAPIAIELLDPVDNRKEWEAERVMIVKAISHHPDFTQFKKISYKAFDTTLRFVSYSQRLDLSNGLGRLTPFGVAVYDMHELLMNHTKDRSRARRLVLQAGMGRKTARLITAYNQEPIEWADCGCCRESGGEESVQLSDGRILQWDGNGQFIEATDTWRRF